MSKAAGPPLRAGFEVVDSPRPGPATGATATVASEDEVVIPAEIDPQHAPEPIYPPGLALPAGAPPIVIASVAYDETGAVTDIAPSVLSPTILDPVGQRLYDAVKATVQRWRFIPGRVIHYRRSSTGERLYVGSEPMGGRVELKFVFDRAHARRSAVDAARD